MLTEYTINKVDRLPDFDPEDPIWQKAQAGEYAYWHEKSSEHHPKTVLRALHDGNDIMLCWQIDDRYVRIVHTATNSMVCEDACVEAFLQPSRRATSTSRSTPAAASTPPTSATGPAHPAASPTSSTSPRTPSASSPPKATCPRLSTPRTSTPSSGG